MVENPDPVGQPDPTPNALAHLGAFPDVLALVKPLNFKLHDECERFIRLVSYRPGAFEFNPAPGAPADLANRLGQILQGATGQRWVISVSDAEGAPTVAEDRRADADAARDEAKTHPLVAAALAAFEIADADADRLLVVKPLRAPDPATPEFLEAVPEDDLDADLLDDGDPFEEGEY